MLLITLELLNTPHFFFFFYKKGCSLSVEDCVNLLTIQIGHFLMLRLHIKSIYFYYEVGLLEHLLLSLFKNSTEKNNVPFLAWFEICQGVVLYSLW